MLSLALCSRIDHRTIFLETTSRRRRYCPWLGGIKKLGGRLNVRPPVVSMNIFRNISARGASVLDCHGLTRVPVNRNQNGCRRHGLI